MENLTMTREKLEQEYEEMTYRVEELEEYVESKDYRGLTYINQQLIIMQIMTMRQYITILANRMVLMKKKKQRK